MSASSENLLFNNIVPQDVLGYDVPVGVVETTCTVVAAYLFLKFLLNPVLRRLAWNVSVISDPYIQRHPGHHAVGWGLWGETPGFDARGWYMFVTHTPLYAVKIVYAVFLFIPMCIQWYFDNDPLNKVPDSSIFAYCANSSLVIMTRFEGSNYVFEMDPKYTPMDFEPVGDCDLGTLCIVFNKDRKVIQAKCKHGPVKGNNKVGRNEVLLLALLNINSGWVHPAIHVNAEKNALEIQAKRVHELEPSAHIVSSLHEGLCHGPIGPKGWMSPFTSNLGSCAQFIHNSFSHPMPMHVIDDRKLEFELYEFVMQGRKEVFRLVREYKLPVDAECLFMNVIMHQIDHTMVYENLSTLPLCSADGSGSLLSYWSTHCYVRIWLKHMDNPTASDMVTSNLDRPFYRDLYAAMSKVNQKRADQMLVSCCF